MRACVRACNDFIAVFVRFLDRWMYCITSHQTYHANNTTFASPASETANKMIKEQDVTTDNSDKSIDADIIIYTAAEILKHGLLLSITLATVSREQKQNATLRDSKDILGPSQKCLLKFGRTFKQLQ